MNALAQRPLFVSMTAGCAALGVSRALAYPDRRVRDRGTGEPKVQPRRLSEADREQALTLMHSDRFIDQAPRQIHAALASEGVVVASVSTLYRLLDAQNEVRERRPQRPPQRHAVPRLQATAPHQVWTWDITKLPTTTPGIFLCLYVILDLFSRYVVGWMVSRKENAGLAKHLFQHTIQHYGIAPATLIVHQDRGAPMTAHSFRELIASLGVTPSYSRPRVSNDNAFSESQFKTTKNFPDYPGHFKDAEHAREWLHAFYPKHLTRAHEGLALFTPEDVFRGRVEQVHAVRQAALDAHYQRYPERYPNGVPKVARPPVVVYINAPDGPAETAAILLERKNAFRPKTPPIEVSMPPVVT